MFIGDLVKIKTDTTRNNVSDMDFITHAVSEDWIFLITSMDDEDLDYIIRPLYSDDGNMIELGAELLVLHDEIAKIELSREQLFDLLDGQRCNLQ